MKTEEVIKDCDFREEENLLVIIAFTYQEALFESRRDFISKVNRADKESIKKLYSFISNHEFISEIYQIVLFRVFNRNIYSPDIPIDKANLTNQTPYIRAKTAEVIDYLIELKQYVPEFIRNDYHEIKKQVPKSFSGNPQSKGGRNKSKEQNKIFFSILASRTNESHNKILAFKKDGDLNKSSTVKNIKQKAKLKGTPITIRKISTLTKWLGKLINSEPLYIGQEIPDGFFEKLQEDIKKGGK